jgi:quinol monooxygenase YgiN
MNRRYRLKLFIVASLLVVSGLTYSAHHEGADGSNPFILIARVHVKEGMVEQYLNAAQTVDEAVEETEPGMLFHNFDSEVYKNSAAFLAHTSNPPVLEYVGQHGELGDGFSIEIYGNVSEAVLKNIEELGFPLTHYKTTRVGYVREEIFR